MYGLILASMLALAAPARSDPFDYFLLALSWSPSWCATVGGPDAEQCDPDLDRGFVLHGLWPQYEDGWPEDCATDQHDPSRRQTAAMADIMGSGGLAWHQWQKHGRCTGLAPEDYFAVSRFAFGLLALPELAPRMTAADVETAFLATNPDHTPESLVVTCRGNLLSEVRLCLTPDLEPRRCGADVARSACRSARPITVPDAP